MSSQPSQTKHTAQHFSSRTHWLRILTAHTHTHTQTNIHSHTHSNKHSFTFIHIHSHVHTHTHTHTQCLVHAVYYTCTRQAPLHMPSAFRKQYTHLFCLWPEWWSLCGWWGPGNGCMPLATHPALGTSVPHVVTSLIRPFPSAYVRISLYVLANVLA